MRADEINPKKLVVFDIDDTLVYTQTKVHVVKDGKVVNSLNSHDFTHYKLQPGEEFDFGDFRNAKDFFNNSKPNIPMMNQLKRDINTGNKVVMVTARADFDDKELFLNTFRKFGVDMSKVHVYRAGNSKQGTTEERKKTIIKALLEKDNYAKAIMYDDAKPNLHTFMELKKDHPKTRFYAWHVSLDGNASEYMREDIGENFAEGVIGNTAKAIKLVTKWQQSGKDEDAFAAIKFGWNFIKNPTMRSIIVKLVKEMSTKNDYPDWNQTVAYIKKNTGIDVTKVNENFADGKKKGITDDWFKDGFKTYKIPNKEKYEIADQDGVIQTLEGPVNYKKGYYIMTGPKGEQYPIPSEKFKELKDDQGNGIATPKKIIKMAKLADHDGAVKTSWGETLSYTKDKDYIVRHGSNDFGVVKVDIFKQTYKQINVQENFADGKKKGKSRPGRVKRAGASCNGSVTSLRKRAKNSSGEKQKMLHWCANMKSGKKK